MAFNPPDSTNESAPAANADTGAKPRREPQDVTAGGPPLRIAADGGWWRGDERYEMDNPRHERIVKLLARILKREDNGDYWIYNPAEKCRITVEDTPFIAVEVKITGEGRGRRLDFRTNLDDLVACDVQHPLVLPDISSSGKTPAEGENLAVPRLAVRGGLMAKLSRAVFYELVNQGEERDIEIGGTVRQVVGIWSRDMFYPLGLL